MKPLPSAQNDFQLPLFEEIFHERGSRKDMQQSNIISSYYIMANHLVAKVMEIEKKKRKLILVVDHSAWTSDQINVFMQESNVDCEILTATTEQEAIALAESAAPDIIMANWNLPGVNGLELIKQLNKSPATRNIPVIIITSSMAPDEESINALKIRMDRWPSN